MLLVDDNIDATRALALLLAHAGFNVVTAHDGGEALARAEERGPTSCCWIWVCRWWTAIGWPSTLRARPDGGDGCCWWPSRATGSLRTASDRRPSGFDHHLVKPIDCAELLALMRDGVGAPRPTWAATAG